VRPAHAQTGPHQLRRLARRRHGLVVEAQRRVAPADVADGFTALLTVDRNLEFQQNIRAAGVGVDVVFAATNRVKELRPLVPLMLKALARLTPGELIRAEAAQSGN
jgi:hypothetical protein